MGWLYLILALIIWAIMIGAIEATGRHCGWFGKGEAVWSKDNIDAFCFLWPISVPGTVLLFIFWCLITGTEKAYKFLRTGGQKVAETVLRKENV